MGYLDNAGLARFWDKVKDYVNEHRDINYIVNAPIGAIIVWSGTEDSVPQGWSICNGENGTLDLRDKFVLAAGTGHSVGDMGGAEEVTLTEAQMPQHDHAYNYRGSANSFQYYNDNNNTTNIGTLKQVKTTKTGSSQPHPNMPPYYTALYIQKTGVTPSDYATEERVQEIVEEALSEQPAGSNVPTGGIIIWSGASDAVPDGWALCDGTNGTPDLRGRFVLGESESHEMGETGGAEEVTLTVAQMPKHNHVTEMFSTNGSSGSSACLTANRTVNNNPGFTSGISGNSQPHPNMPPYYVLCYIMKI